MWKPIVDRMWSIRVGMAAIVLLSAGAAGCLEIPLGDPDQSSIDPRLLGYWQTQESDGKTDLVSIEAADKHVLLIRMYAYRQADDGVHKESQSAYTGWLTPVGGETFLTVEVRDPEEVFKPEAERKRAYMISKLAFGEGWISLMQIKDDMGKQAHTPAELARLIADNVDKPELYEAEQQWTKVTDSGLVGTVVSAFTAQPN